MIRASPSSRQSFHPPEEVQLMVESRWLRWVGPGVVALGAVGAIASSTLGAGERPWTPRACGGLPSDRGAAAREAAPAGLAALRAAPWFRLDPVLDAEGALNGQRLSIGLDGDRLVRSLGLPAESFAAGPFGRVVLVGADDGFASHLQAVDVASGCSWPIADETAVVRRAVLDPAGASIFETRVDRETRADLGLWRRSIDGTSPARQVLAPLAADDRFGRTFSTELAWDVAGRRLAVQSCGEVACRTRVVGPDTDATVTLETPDLGLLVGFDADRIVTYGACRGLPCQVVSTDLRTAERRVLAERAGLAVVVATADGPRLVHEVVDGAASRIRSVALDGGSPADLGALPAGFRLHASADRSGSATRLPSDWILLAPDGRLPATATTLRPQLRHLPDGATVPLDEVAR
jgi:hypothetical protein